MHDVATAILVAWAAFWVYWIAVSVDVKPGSMRWGRFAGVRLAIVVLALALVRAGTFRQASVTGDPWLQGTGVFVFLSGLATALWARRYLGRNWGTPMSQKVDPELVTGGPYGKVRHPIYSGIILAMVGTAIAVSWYWMIVAAVMGAYFVYSATVEERYMTGLFPEEYPAYKASTKMLIPFVF